MLSTSHTSSCVKRNKEDAVTPFQKPSRQECWKAPWPQPPKSGIRQLQALQTVSDVDNPMHLPWTQDCDVNLKFERGGVAMPPQMSPGASVTSPCRLMVR
jgi:hypothetical protein